MANPFGPFARANAGLVLFNDGTGAPVSPNSFNGFLIDDADQIYSVTDGTIDHWENGLPFDADGRLVISSGDVAYFDQGLPFTADGMVCVGADVIDHIDQGTGFDVDSKLAQSGGGAAPYLLLTQFADVINQPVTLVDGQTLHQDNDGMTEGQMAVRDISTGTMVFDESSDCIRGVGSGTAYDTAIINENGLTRADGLVIFWDIAPTIDSGGPEYAGIISLQDIQTPTAANRYFQVNYFNNNVDDDESYFYFFDPLGTIVVGGILIDGTTLNVKDKFALVLTNTQCFLYLKHGAETEYTLLFVFDVAPPSTIYAITGFAAAASQMELYNFKCDESNLQPALVTPQFYQSFSNSDGSGAVGGTTSDPTSLVNIEISSGTLHGVASFSGSGNDTVTNTLDVAIPDGAIITYQWSLALVNARYNRVRVYDSLGQQICRIELFASGSFRIQVFNKANALVAEIYNNGAAPAGANVLFGMQLIIDLTAKTLSVYSHDIAQPLSNNVNIDISSGGGMVSTDIKSNTNQIVSAAGQATNQFRFDNLKYYPRTRSITP